MSFIFPAGLEYRAQNGLQGETIEMVLCMTNTTASVDDSTGRDAATVSGIGNLDEFDGGGAYTSGFGNRPTLSGVTIAKDLVRNDVGINAADVTLDPLNPSTRKIAGLLLSIAKTSDSDSIPYAWVDEGGFPATATGFAKTFEWGALGIERIGPPGNP